MQKVSSAYKLAMDNLIRERAYISISVGVVSQEAQASAVASGDFTDFTDKKSIFRLVEEYNEYASYENNYWQADGRQLLKPRNSDLYINTGLVTNDFKGKLKVSFDNSYGIRGLTIVFGTAYPTKFTVKTSTGQNYQFVNNASQFETDTPFGEISWLEIEALEMVGGNQRLHIHEILCGIGLVFGNDKIEKADRKESVSPISEELPSRDFTVTVFDENGVFNVEDDNSFINYLEQKQIISCSIGMTLQDGSIEWVKMGYTYLKDWKNTKGKMTFSSTDLIEQMDDEYIIGNTIDFTDERSAADVARSIFEDMGMLPDEYYIDDYLDGIKIRNPMPEGRHSECLQLLANACRCVVYQDRKRIIRLQSNFEQVNIPENVYIETSDGTYWSNTRHLLTGASVTYTEFMQDAYKLNDTMYIMPTQEEIERYGEMSFFYHTGYVSYEISNENGYFTNNPYVELSFDGELHRFFSFELNFGSNPAKEIRLTTYRYNKELEIEEVLETVDFNNLKNDNLLFNPFEPFDKVRLEILRTVPNNRIIVNKFSFSNTTDYSLVKQDMLENPIGYKNQVTKSVSVKVFTYENDDKGNPKEVDDDIWVTNEINSIGVNVKVENPLISTVEMAEKVAEWIGNHYKNNIYYDVKFRGEPRIEANDVIKMDSDVLNNLNAEINSVQLSFNGAFKGNLGLHKI